MAAPSSGPAVSWRLEPSREPPKLSGQPRSSRGKLEQSPAGGASDVGNISDELLSVTAPRSPASLPFHSSKDAIKVWIVAQLPPLTGCCSLAQVMMTSRLGCQVAGRNSFAVCSAKAGSRGPDREGRRNSPRKSGVCSPLQTNRGVRTARTTYGDSRRSMCSMERSVINRPARQK